MDTEPSIVAKIVVSVIRKSLIAEFHESKGGHDSASQRIVHSMNSTVPSGLFLDVPHVIANTLIMMAIVVDRRARGWRWCRLLSGPRFSWRRLSVSLGLGLRATTELVGCRPVADLGGVLTGTSIRERALALAN